MIPKEILVVNDGSQLLPLVGGLLATGGYRLSPTDSPEEALILLNTRKFDLVVLKMNGKQIDRLSVMHMVEELNQDSKLVIVAEQARPPVEIFEIKADDYILLPCRPLEIYRRLLTCLEPSSRRPGLLRENNLMHPVNRQIFKNLALMFQEMQDQATSIVNGLKLLKIKLNSRLEGETEDTYQEAFERTETLIRMTGEFFRKFLYIKPPQMPPDCFDPEFGAVQPHVKGQGHG